LYVTATITTKHFRLNDTAFCFYCCIKRFNTSHQFRKCVVWFCGVKNHKPGLWEKRLKLSGLWQMLL